MLSSFGILKKHSVANQNLIRHYFASTIVLSEKLPRENIAPVIDIKPSDTEDQVNPEDEGIHPEWLAMERRVKSRRTKPRKEGDNQPTRSVRRSSAWDGENV